MILLDSSFLFAYLQESDTNHQQALSDAKKVREESLIMPQDILKELVTLICYKISSSEAIKVYKLFTMENSPIIILDNHESDLHKCLNLFEELSPHKISYVDCLLIYLSKKLNAKVLSYDKKLNKYIQQIS